jgi:hypothetical protein
MELLCRPALTLGQDIIPRIGQTAVFGRTFSPGAGSTAATADLKLNLQSFSEVALAALRILFLGVTATLFVLWLISDAGRSVSNSTANTDCVSAGRGRANCEKGIASANGGNQTDCISLGRGGLVCDKSSAK